MRWNALDKLYWWLSVCVRLDIDWMLNVMIPGWQKLLMMSWLIRGGWFIWRNTRWLIAVTFNYLILFIIKVRGAWKCLGLEIVCGQNLWLQFVRLKTFAISLHVCILVLKLSNEGYNWSFIKLHRWINHRFSNWLF